jgi:hypothetical protein
MIDRRVAQQLYLIHPQSLSAFLEYIAAETYNKIGIKIDVSKVHAEIAAIMDIDENMDYEKYRAILLSHSIQAVPIQLKLLKVIFEELPREFTIVQLSEVLEKKRIPISFDSILFNIGRFKLKGIIEQCQINTNHPGGPETKLVNKLKPG